MKISTSHKPKLPKQLSFPIGAKGINDTLSDIELDEEISLFFNNEAGRRMGYYRPGYALVKMKGESSDLLSFRRVISVNYSHPRQLWNITVYPASKDRIVAVKELIKNVGLKLIHDWLLKPKTQTWYRGHRYLILGLHESGDGYCLWETHNDRTIKKEIKKHTQQGV